MEDFKKKIQLRFTICLAFCGLGTGIFQLLRKLIENAPDYSRGMVYGVFMAIELLAVFYMIRCRMLLGNEEKLKKEYIKATDERSIAISKETMRTSSLIIVMCTGLAVIISSFFNQTVSTTLVADMTVSALITTIVNLYYNKKM